MPKITITINNNEMHYDAQECEAKDFSAIINASISHLKSEFQDKGQVIDQYIASIEKSLESLKS